jgi:uncharacterized protein
MRAGCNRITLGERFMKRARKTDEEQIRVYTHRRRAPYRDRHLEGTHPLAGRYHSNTQFIEATFTRLGGVLPGGVKLEVTHLYLDGDTAIAELHSTSTTNEGAQFANNYCWVRRFDGDIIVEVRAYLDSMMVAYTILRNEHVPQTADR